MRTIILLAITLTLNSCFLFRKQPNDKITLRKVSQTEEWINACSAPEKKHNSKPSVKLLLEKNGAPFADQKIWVTELAGDVLSLHAVTDSKTGRENKVLFIKTDQNGEALLNVDLTQAAIGSPGLEEGVRTLSFAYIPDKSTGVIQEFVNYKLIKDCDKRANAGKKTHQDIDEARIHIQWALDDLANCTQDLPCVEWNKVVNIFGQKVWLTRKNTSARDQILRAIAAHLSSKHAGMTQYEDLAFELVLSTQIHKDGKKTRDWMIAHKPAVMAALDEVSKIQTVTNVDLKTLLHDMFPTLPKVPFG